LRARFRRALAQCGFIERLHELVATSAKHDEFFIAAIDGSYSDIFRKGLESNAKVRRLFKRPSRRPPK
jgi:hypothetical protein